MNHDLVVAELDGRLGNQLFQFAAAKGLQSDPSEPVPIIASYGTPSLLPSVLRERTTRELKIGEYLALRLAPSLPIGSRTVSRLLANLTPTRVFEHDRRLDRGYDPRIGVAQRPTLLRGLFQNERYFAHRAGAVVGSIRKPSSDASGALHSIAFSVGSREPVAVSVRSGDYVSLGWALPDSYFVEAAERISSSVDRPFFVLFGDVRADCERIARRLQRLGPSVVMASANPVDDLHVIARQPHHILANSSFAWWAAWLGDQLIDSAMRMVVRPDPWLTPGDELPVRWLPLRRSTAHGAVPSM